MTREQIRKYQEETKAAQALATQKPQLGAGVDGIEEEEKEDLDGLEELTEMVKNFSTFSVDDPSTNSNKVDV